MVGRLRSMWRGEIQLWKVFWVFGIVGLLLFSFIFIISQGTIVAILGKSSSAPLDLNCFLTLVFAVYGIFVIVAIWRSAKKHGGSKIWSPLAKLTSILVVLWFGGNLGLYVLVKTVIPPAMEARIDYLPEKLKLSKSDIEADSLYLRNFQLEFPFYKEDMKNASPFFYEHQIMGISIFLGTNSLNMISFHELADSLPVASPSIGTKILDWLLNKEDYGPYTKALQEIHCSRLKDYSWWNLRYNLRLAVNLTLKAMAIPAYDDLKIYDVVTPYLKGYLSKGHSKSKMSLISFYYELEGKSYAVSAFTSNEEIINKVMNMLSTIQPVVDVDKGYKEMEAQYRHTDKTRYPDELLLLSLISLKGPTVDNLKELLRIEEHIHANKLDIDGINQEINFLSRPLK